MKNENQAQKKSVGSNVLIIVLILIILATSAFGIFAWARYQTSVEGEGTAQVAKWSFKVNGNTSQTEHVVFAITRDDGNTTVTEGTIAPGTSGKIDISVDVSGTQTDLVYTIIGSMQNKPTNLRLYFDAERTQEMIVVGENFSKGNYMTLQDIQQSPVRTETIYWEWPFETGTTDEEKTRNNLIDTEDMRKEQITMQLTVEGKQINGAPALADLVQIGDYVNYNASSEGIQTFTAEQCAEFPGLGITEIFSTADDFAYDAEKTAPPAQWRVINIDRKNNKVELMSVDPTKYDVILSGKDGLLSSKSALDAVASIYGHGYGAEKARSITQEDVEQFSTYNPKTENTTGNLNMGETIVYTTGDFLLNKMDENGNLLEFETELVTATEESPVTMTQTYYYYSTKSYILNSMIYNSLYRISNNLDNTKGYWLNSRGVNLKTTDGARYGLGVVAGGSKQGCPRLYDSNGGEGSSFYKIVPIVELKKDVRTIGQVDGVWQLKVD